jgi:DAPG hydrolase-like protein
MKAFHIAGGMFLCLVVLLAIVGSRPFAVVNDTRPLLEAGYTDFETGVRRLPNGTIEVSALTRMPNVKAAMVRWWFADFLQTTEQYKWWHPTDHVWMDWENKVPGEIVGASHLVHEYIGGELGKLRIQFVDPKVFFDVDPNSADTVVVCARAGLLEEPVNVARMCHFVRDTPWGSEMRSRFWMGHVATRQGNEEITSLVGIIGNMAIVRLFALDRESGEALLKHAVEEMGYLSDLLPALYAREQAGT